MLAILFSALAPSISHALNAANPAADRIEICTAGGIRMVDIPSEDGGKTPASAKISMEHCAFCASHGGSVALLSAPSLTILVDAGRDVYPPLYYAAPRSLHAWSAANPRAPPFIS